MLPNQSPPPLDPRRSRNVGASEVASLFSILWDDPTIRPDEITPFSTRYGLWMLKAGRLAQLPEPKPEFEGGPRPALKDRKFWGSMVEQTVANALAETLGWGIRRGRFVEHPSFRGMSATTDFEVGFDAGDVVDAVLEVKNVDWLEFKRWTEEMQPGVDWYSEGEWVQAYIQPPFRYKLQLQAQLACTGYRWGILAVFVGGNELYLFRIERNERAIQRIESEIKTFWHSIERNEPPDPNWRFDAETVVALHGKAEPDTVVSCVGHPEALAAAHAYFEAQADEAEAKKRKTAAKAKILQIVGEAERAIFDDGIKLSAGVVKGCYVAYEREAYRNFRLTQGKTK